MPISIITLHKAENNQQFVYEHVNLQRELLITNGVYTSNQAVALCMIALEKKNYRIALLGYSIQSNRTTIHALLFCSHFIAIQT